MSRTSAIVLIVLAALLALPGCANEPPPVAPSAATTTVAAPAPATRTASPAEIVGPAGVDEAFLKVIRSKGIGTDDDEREIRRGHVVCEFLQEGKSFRDVLTALLSAGLGDIEEAGFFSGAAVSAYCPDQSGKLTT